MLKNKLEKPRSFLDKIKGIFSKGGTADFSAIEEILIGADIDVRITDELIKELENKKISSFEEAKSFLKIKFLSELQNASFSIKANLKPYVIILIGINGGGKTTTAAKMAKLYKDSGKKVLLVAADTFRAAAIEQIEQWGKKLGVEVASGMDGADPASVVFDSIAKAKKSGVDVVLIDTAGRLHTKINLMEELAKIKRVILKEVPAENTDIYIIIDSNTGKNAFAQAKQFNDTLGLAGVILTKFDSTSKGGSIIKIKSELGLPIKYLTYGEKLEDIAVFDPEEFIDNLFES